MIELLLMVNGEGNIVLRTHQPDQIPHNPFESAFSPPPHHLYNTTICTIQEWDFVIELKVMTSYKKDKINTVCN